MGARQMELQKQGKHGPLPLQNEQRGKTLQKDIGRGSNLITPRTIQTGERRRSSANVTDAMQATPEHERSPWTMILNQSSHPDAIEACPKSELLSRTSTTGSDHSRD